VEQERFSIRRGTQAKGTDVFDHFSCAWEWVKCSQDFTSFHPAGLLPAKSAQPLLFSWETTMWLREVSVLEARQPEKLRL